MAPKLRGGVHQRLAAADALGGEPAAGPLGQSRLAKALVDMHLWGDLSPQQVQTIAAAAQADAEAMGSAVHPMVLRLAGIGGRGQFPQNAHRDLQRQLKASSLEEALMDCRIHYRQPPLRILVSTQLILLPHLLFAAFYQDYAQFFRETIMGGGEHVVNAFWQAIAGHPQLRLHPRTAGARGRATPSALSCARREGGWGVRGEPQRGFRQEGRGGRGEGGAEGRKELGGGRSQEQSASKRVEGGRARGRMCERQDKGGGVGCGLFVWLCVSFRCPLVPRPFG